MPDDPRLNVRETLERLAELIQSYYVVPEDAEKLAAEVLEIGHGGELSAADAKTVASTLTAKLRELTADWHFSVEVRQFTAEEAAAAPEDRWKYRMPGRTENFGFRSVEVVESIATLAISSLVPIAWSAKTAHAAMEFCRHASGVIIDLRRCAGGDPDLIALLISYFLGESPVLLSSVRWRDTGEEEPMWTRPGDARFRFSPDVALYVVVGPRTASGAEALAYDLQGLGRARVVGQPTLGAAHRVKQFEIGDGLIATIPCGKVTNPITGVDWEDGGVIPDVAVPEGGDPWRVAYDMATRG